MILACQKLLGQITKVLGFGETLPPRMGKTPKKSRIFFLTGSLIAAVFIIQYPFPRHTFLGKHIMQGCKLLQTDDIKFCKDINIPTKYFFVCIFRISAFVKVRHLYGLIWGSLSVFQLISVSVSSFLLWSFKTISID